MQRDSKTADEEQRDAKSFSCYHKGVELARLGKHNEAMIWYRKGLKETPDHPLLWFSMGASLTRLDELDQALSCYNRAIQLDPDMEEAWSNKAYTLRQQGNYEEAISTYQTIIQLFPSIPQVWDGLGVTYYEDGKVEEAVQCLKKATEISPAFYQAWNNLGQYLLKLNKPQEARDCFKEALNIKSDYANALSGKQECDRLLKQSRPSTKPLSNPEVIELGQILMGRYEVLTIHSGGMGVVYGVWDHQTKSRYALKTFKPEYFLDQVVIDKFVEEGTAWIKLGLHRNIVPALWVEIIRGNPYVVVEYIEGRDLYSMIKNRQMDAINTQLFAIQFCTGMMYVTERDMGKGHKGLLHLDIKPQNILIDDGNVLKITDFGLAKAIPVEKCNKEGVTAHLYQSQPLGTKLYMSPEQRVPGKLLDVRSDIYSFGLVLYEMLTGLLTYSYQPKKLWDCVAQGALKMPHLVNPDVSLALSNITMRCLAVEREKRFSDFSELREALIPVYQECVGEAYPVEELSVEGGFPESDLTLTEIHAVSLARLGEEEEAQKLFDRILVVDSKRASTWMNKAMFLRNNGKYQEALSALARSEKMVKGNENLVSLYVLKAAILDEIDRFEDAVDVCDTALAMLTTTEYENKQIVSVLGNKANALTHLKRYEEALSLYDKALSYQCDDDNIYFNRGHLFHTQGRWEEALQDEELALNINPRNAYVLAEKGFILLSLNRHEEAVVCFQKARSTVNKLLPLLRIEDATALYNRASELEEGGHYEKALLYLEVLILDRPTALNAWMHKGYCLSALDRHLEAVVCHNRALEIDRSNYQIWLNRAVSLFLLGEYQEALDSVKETLKLKPDHLNAKNLYQKCTEKLESTLGGSRAHELLDQINHLI